MKEEEKNEKLKFWRKAITLPHYLISHFLFLQTPQPAMLVTRIDDLLQSPPIKAFIEKSGRFKQALEEVRTRALMIDGPRIIGSTHK